MCPRWIFTVISASQASAAMFVHEAEATNASISARGGSGLEKGVQVGDDLLTSRLFRSGSIAVTTSGPACLVGNGLGRKSTRCPSWPSRSWEYRMAGHEDDWNVNVRLG